MHRRFKKLEGKARKERVRDLMAFKMEETLEKESGERKEKTLNAKRIVAEHFSGKG